MQEGHMKTFASAIIAIIGFALVVPDADARRFGGGRNLGMQRSAPAQAQKAAPAQQQQAQQQQGAPAQQPAGASKWLGPLAGLALGAGLAALFLNNGIAGLLAGLLLIGLVAAALYFVGRALLGRQSQRPLQYAGMPGSGPTPAALPGSAAPHSVAATMGTSASASPAGLDEAEFLRHAKLNFMRLQEAHDSKDLSAMRDFLAPEVYRSIEADIQASWGAAQKTEVLALEAELVEVTREAGSYIVSVRFSGSIREAADREPERFSEIWHLEKPVSGRGGWIVAGIQQS
jgi:predicted lipid-binding transport protein (Tim44 family)